MYRMLVAVMLLQIGAPSIPTTQRFEPAIAPPVIEERAEELGLFGLPLPPALPLVVARRRDEAAAALEGGAEGGLVSDSLATGVDRRLGRPALRPGRD